MLQRKGQSTQYEVKLDPRRALELTENEKGDVFSS